MRLRRDGPERKSVSKWGDDEAEAQEYLENCRRTPRHHGERTLAWKNHATIEQKGGGGAIAVTLLPFIASINGRVIIFD